MARGWMVGIDVGGTFTDAVAVHRDGSTAVAKVPSTPNDPSRGLLDALESLAGDGVEPGSVDLLFHGTTVATNALLTGRGSRLVLLATEGFRDIMSYRDGCRPQLYSLTQPRPQELADREDRIEVHERLSGLGEVVVPLGDEEIRRVVRAAEERAPEAIAVAFLFSYLDDTHERRVADALRAALPGVPVTISSDVAREFREYPRTATAAVNASLRPIVGVYVREAAARAAELGVEAPFLVMQSNGGCVPAERAEGESHRLLLSGPTAGVAGAVALGLRHELDRVIAFDVGGTSLDVCLVQGGVPPTTPVQVVEDHPILAPSVDIVTAGAGGGSIASVDRAGRLRVGPQSAGADPGPAAYGRGGTEATLTDAHVVTGVLSRDTPLAGSLELDGGEARRAMERVAEKLGLDAETTAEGVIEVAAAHAVAALRRVSVERGVDPREFTLVAFGGAGPLLAGRMLRELDLAGLLIPPYPGLFSAGGLMASSLRIDESQTVLRLLDDELAVEALAWYRNARARLTAQLREDRIPRSRIRFVGSADCRYQGQGYELDVPLPALSATGINSLAARFERAHEALYGHANPGQPVEVVTLRLSAFGDLDTPDPPLIPRGARRPTRAARGADRSVLLPGARRRRRVGVYRRELLRSGNVVDGPAIIDQMDATTLVLAGQDARVDVEGNIWVRHKAASR